MNLAEFIEGRRDQHLAELCELLRIPSVSAKSEHKPDIERGARWVADNLRAAGFKSVEIVPTNLHPLVYAESLEAPGKPTILFYGHYDVQPAEPLDLWTTPAFEPTVRYGNLFGGATAEEIAVAHGGFESGRGPEIERLGGLHVVVAVEKDGGFAGSFERFRVDERVQIGRNNFNRLKSCSAEIIRDPASATLDIRLVFALGAHAGNAQEFAKLRQMLVAATFDKFSKVHKGPSGAKSPFEV